MNDKDYFCGCPSPEPEVLPISGKEADEKLASLAKALANPARILILRILARRKACMCGDIVSEMALSQSTVSEHLRILKEAGAIIGEVDGPRVCYCINRPVLDYFKSLVSGL